MKKTLVKFGIVFVLSLFAGGCASISKTKIEPSPTDKKLIAELENDPSIGFVDVKPGEVVLPVLREVAEPIYPIGLEKKASAVVKVSVLVEDTGEISAAEIIESTDHRFDSSALATVKRYRFEPAKFRGKPVVMAVKLDVKFGSSKN